MRAASRALEKRRAIKGILDLLAACVKRPDGVYGQRHLDNWTDDDFAKHAAATRKTLAWLLELEKIVKGLDTP